MALTPDFPLVGKLNWRPYVDEPLANLKCPARLGVGTDGLALDTVTRLQSGQLSRV